MKPYTERDAGPFIAPATPVPILQRQWEFEELLAMYCRKRPLNVLEIGTFHGGTLYHWLQNAAPGAHIVSVDSYAVHVDNRHLYADWTPDLVTLETISGESGNKQTIERVAAHGPYDWIFIDADHLEAGVQSDWDNYYTMAAPGGIIALHDILPASVNWIQVDPVWQRIQRLGYINCEFVADPSADWGGIGCVFML